MKTRTLRLGAAMLASIAAGATVATAQSQKGKPAAVPVLELRTERTEYTLGEPLRLEITARNEASGNIVLSGAFDVGSGYVGIAVAYEDGDFREYRGPGWGLDDVAPQRPLTLRPRQGVATQATVLYNHGMPSSHLNADAARTIDSQYLPDGYALPRPGRYRIAALLHVAGLGEPVQSPPVEILVREPGDGEREAWSLLGSDAEFGYFMQTGGWRARSSEARREQLVAALERLTTEHPASRYSEALRDRLEKYRELLDALAARGIVAAPVQR